MKTLIGLTAILSLAAVLMGCTHNLAINTDPPGASIRLTEVGGDKKFELGQSPIKTQVTAAGEYMLTAEKPGYTTIRKRIEVGEKEHYDIALTPVFEIAIDSEPEGASIVLEDKGTGETYRLGKAPVKHYIESKGPFSVKAGMEGYTETAMDVAAVPGRREVALTVKLTPTATMRPTAETAPVPTETRPAAPVPPTGPVTPNEPVPVSAATQISAPPSLETAKGEVYIGSEPPSADVYINGSYMATTPADISLDAGDCTMVIVKEGYKAETVKLSVKEGVNTPLNVRLNPRKQ